MTAAAARRRRDLSRVPTLDYECSEMDVHSPVSNLDC